MKSLKPYRLPLIMIAAAFSLLGGAFVIFSWEPWDRPSTRERELAWLTEYAAWLGGVESQLAAGERPRPVECRARFENVVGPPPSPRLHSVARLAADGCAAPTPERWRDLGSEVQLHLLVKRFSRVRTTDAPILARAVWDVAERLVRVHCWPRAVWTLLSEDLGAIEGDDLGWAGFADLERRRIHLAPEVCRPLRRFFNGPFAPWGNQESYDLAYSLKTLAHEAEHVRNPDASEAVVECYAIQDVRPLVLARGRKRPYANELAGLAELASSEEPAEYRTPDCRNNGPLDRNPDRSAWP